MPSLTERLLNAAGLKYDRLGCTWAALVPPRLVVTVERTLDAEDVVDALAEIHDILDAKGYTYSHFALNGRYVSLVGLTLAPAVAVA